MKCDENFMIIDKKIFYYPKHYVRTYIQKQ